MRQLSAIIWSNIRTGPVLLTRLAARHQALAMPRPDPASVAPTRARLWIIVFAVTLAIIQYVDRVCISQAAPQVSLALGLNKEQMGWVFSAFTLAYALFEIPTGYWGDRRGPR